MAGLSIPVAPYKRYSFVFASANPIPGRMPNVIDLSGTFVRPEGELFLTGNTPQGDGPAGYDDFEMHHGEFDDYIWPALRHRIPSFDALKVHCYDIWEGYNIFLSKSADISIYFLRVPIGWRILLFLGWISRNCLNRAVFVIKRCRGVADFFMPGNSNCAESNGI